MTKYDTLIESSMPPKPSSTQSLPVARTARRFERASSSSQRRAASPPLRRLSFWQRLRWRVLHAWPEPQERRCSTGGQRRSHSEDSTHSNRLQKSRPAHIPRVQESLSASEACSKQEGEDKNTLQSAIEPRDGNPDPGLSSRPEIQAPERPSSRVSIFGILGIIKSFSFDLEKSFLTPMERYILELLSRVDNAGRFQSSITLQPPLLFMPDSDSTEALWSLQDVVQHYGGRDREMLSRDLDRLLTEEQRIVLKMVLYNNVQVLQEDTGSLSPSESSYHSALTASRGCAGPQPGAARAVSFEQTTPRRPQFIEHFGPLPERGIVVRREVKVTREKSCLRGGGGSDGAPRPAFDLCNLVRRPRPLKGDQRPHPMLWWLAGGKIRRAEPALGVPKASTLRERRIVENANRDRVGFWGTVAGLRDVHCTRKQLAEACRRVAATKPNLAVDGEQPAGGAASSRGDEAVRPLTVRSNDGKPPSVTAGKEKVAEWVKSVEGAKQDPEGAGGKSDGSSPREVEDHVRDDAKAAKQATVSHKGSDKTHRSMPRR